MNEKIEETLLEQKESTSAVRPTCHDENKKTNFSFRKYLLNIWLSFLDSFKYNPCKLAGILVALPGLFIGFFLEFHSKVKFIVRPSELDLSGFYMFVMVLLGCINIFNGMSLSAKRNTNSVLISLGCSLVIAVVGVLWICGINHSFALVNSKEIELKSPLVLDVNIIMSVVCVILAIICSLVGCILGLIKRNKNYKKVKF